MEKPWFLLQSEMPKSGVYFEKSSICYLSTDPSITPKVNIHFE